MKPTMFHNVSLLTKCNLCLVSGAYCCRRHCSTAARQTLAREDCWWQACSWRLVRGTVGTVSALRQAAICRYLHRYILLRLRRYLDIFILPLLLRCPEIQRWYAVDRGHEGGAANIDRGVAQGVDPSHFRRILRIIHVLQQDLQIYAFLWICIYLL